MRCGTVGIIGIFALGLLVAPLAAHAQPSTKVPRVGVLSPQKSTEPPTVQREPFEQGLRALGWVPGVSILIEYRYAEGDIERLPEIAAELVGLPVDVIVARAPQAIHAAQRATTTIPIVMSAGADPVRSGFVASPAQPGGNITGLAVFFDDLGAKQLEFLKEALPHVARVAVLVNPNMMVEQDRPFVEGLNAAARALKMEVQIVEVSRPADIAEAFTAIERGRGEALLIRPDPHVLEPHAAQVVALALTHRLPAIYPWRLYVNAGGLMSYATSLPDIHRRSATYIDKILKGAKPADLPVEQPMKFELAINLKTAQALGLPIPPMLLFQADEVIR